MRIDLSVGTRSEFAGCVLAAIRSFGDLLSNNGGELLVRTYEGPEHILRLNMSKDDAEVAVALVVEDLSTKSSVVAAKFKAHAESVLAAI